MILNLDPNWFLDCDTTNVVLTERRTITGENTRGLKPKAENIGKTREVQHGFYGSITQACQGYLNKGVASMEGVMTATQVIAAWTDMTARIESACKTLPRCGAEIISTAPESMEAAKQAESRMHRQTMIQTADGVITLPSKSHEPLYQLPQA
jgi:hypothetical protein